MVRAVVFCTCARVFLIVDYLTETDENVYRIDFVHFRIRDMKSNKVLFEVQREPGEWRERARASLTAVSRRRRRGHGRRRSHRWSLRSVSVSSGVSEAQASRRSVSATDARPRHSRASSVGFKVGAREVKSFRMIERHFFRDQLIKSFDFDFGFCPPNTTNSIEHIYDMPEIDSKQSEPPARLPLDSPRAVRSLLVKEMINHPNETKSDSFYFVDNQLIMHKKAVYAFDLD